MRKEKIRQTDFKDYERPSTRLRQFGDIFKHRFLELIKISLLQTVFNMPLIASVILFYVLVRNSTNMNALMTVFIIQSGALFISLPISFIGLTGSFYCMKKLIYAEGEFASSSYFIGLREEWKKGLIIGLLPGFSVALSIIGYYFFCFYLSDANPIIAGFGIAILAIQLILVMMISYYSIGQTVIYSNTVFFTFKNSLIMMLIRFPYNLLFFILYPGIFIALFCIMEITMFVGVGLLVFFSAIGHLMWMLNNVAAFDRFINKESYPDYYRKGLSDIKNTEV